MEAKLVALGVETFKIALLLALPGLLTGMLLGLAVSIFQAVTSIQELTLTFIPKILAVFLSVLLFFPWLMQLMITFTSKVLINFPEYIQ